jgi:hypothetical protein
MFLQDLCQPRTIDTKINVRIDATAGTDHAALTSDEVLYARCEQAEHGGIPGRKVRIVEETFRDPSLTYINRTFL